MKTIGLIGGMSFESSLEYYRMINELARVKLGGFHSAKSIMYSVDFSEIEEYQKKGQWDKAGKVLIEAAKSLENGGANFVLLCTNTMHKVANQIETAINIPMIHIADATGEKIIKDGIKKIGLLGTKYTMQEDFYKQRLSEKYDIEVLVPDTSDIEVINKVIFEELVFGIIKDESKKRYLKIMDELIVSGAEGIILGCTEIGLLVKQNDTKIPIYDTTYLHAKKAVEMAIGIK